MARPYWVTAQRHQGWTQVVLAPNTLAKRAAKGWVGMELAVEAETAPAGKVRAGGVWVAAVVCCPPAAACLDSELFIL